MTAAGHVDMPPFPPGLTLSREHREGVSKAWWQGAAMAVLGGFCKLEGALPEAAKRSFAHIVYCAR